MKYLKFFLLYIWQLPQNLLGALIVFFSASSKVNGIYKPVKDNKYLSAISLGNYIIIFQEIFINDTTIKHEKGHQKQSLYLGWLYLLFIGLPSLLGNIIHRFIKFNYYRQPWESWADKLGVVKRS